MGGGQTVEGRVWGGAVPLPQKKIMNFYLKRWILVHSRITFYVYAKIGQVNGGRQHGPSTRLVETRTRVEG